MEVLTSLIPKLAELLIGEYNLQKEVKGGIIFLQAELEHIKVALEKISRTPVDQLDEQDKIWARDVRELSYDIEDKIDTFMVRCKVSKTAKGHGFKKVLDRSLDLLTQPKIRRKIATDIRDIKGRVKDVSERRDRYKFNNNDVLKPVRIDPRLFTRYEKAVELIGIDEATDEVISILGEDNEVSMAQDKIVSIVGFGGLGKTTIASVVYEKLRARFDCSAFVSVSQTPDMDKLLKDMFYQLAKRSNSRINVLEELREFLDNERYLIVIDDIWDVIVWKMIKCALPDNNVGCKIITTTRILTIAEQAGDAYKLKPLSLENSRKLLYRRIFRTENVENSEGTGRCLDDLAEVSNKILNKCAGVPLAIIMIASLLASKGKNKMEWYEVCNYMGAGMENSLDAENMRTIMSYSYYDLPSNLRTCLLYLSVFPEDFGIEKDRLIWLWIAEGFIQCEEQRKSLFSLGESYFNELANRSMIQPVYNDFGNEARYCRVHDMVLDLIRSISNQENFVTILSDHTHKYNTSTTIRRLSVQSGKIDYASTQGTRSMPQVRSVFVFSASIEQMPPLQSFRVLRVLDLQECNLSQGFNPTFLGNLFHLRYLSLRDTQLGEIPEKVGKLQFLEILDLGGTSISHLPSTVGELKHLLFLSVGWSTVLPNWIGSLRSLEQLFGYVNFNELVNDKSTDIIEELGLLAELRVLRICLLTGKWNDKLMDSVRKLQKLQDLCIFKRGGQRSINVFDDWVAPRCLRRLDTLRVFWFSRLPVWMNNTSHLVDLSHLSIAVRELEQKDLEILGRLPSLCRLQLEVDHQDIGIVGRLFTVGSGSFPCLVFCELRGFLRPVLFQQGALPKLGRLAFDFHVREAREINGTDGGFNLGLGNLPSLEYVGVSFRSAGASQQEVEEAKTALKQATEIHPNRPKFQIER